MSVVVFFVVWLLCRLCLWCFFILDIVGRGGLRGICCCLLV